ncbi:(Fe-S)-binding protein [Halioglobus maricola]|uniref:(Fe-S)-binding protein n=1 Tax=Halioglobus maricola TaxID=2601894 RepID=A0A5P9NHK1_9GAMM|nr:(Fe-S)-binding protein [Halioglobus maricola]QFU75303.1 (Fe-S)-binding protein [Halioglobus maricola]
MNHSTAPQVSLFVTCLADLMRPSVAFATIRLLEHAGCEVSVPVEQTCCGQPGYNSGEYESTIPVAKRTIELFEHAEYVVAPSGSCAGMIVHHYPKLLTGEWRERALALAEKTWELTSFLTDVVKLDTPPAHPTQLPPLTYHDSCAGLRELGIKEQPRQLLKSLCGVDVTEMQQSDVCCGFGGTFCAKMPDISAKMADDKLRNASATNAAILTGGDLGCLLNIAGRARREGLDIEVRHVAEILSGDLYGPAIGEREG